MQGETWTWSLKRANIARRVEFSIIDLTLSVTSIIDVFASVFCAWWCWGQCWCFPTKLVTHESWFECLTKDCWRNHYEASFYKEAWQQRTQPISWRVPAFKVVWLHVMILLPNKVIMSHLLVSSKSTMNWFSNHALLSTVCKLHFCGCPYIFQGDLCQLTTRKWLSSFTVLPKELIWQMIGLAMALSGYNLI